MGGDMFVVAWMRLRADVLIPNPESRIPNPESRIPNPESRIPNPAMRLTLRTMLAHLDGILDPADSEDLARKIAENEFAGTLAQRIGEVTKRLRLGAPKVLGKGTALDPNTVAEYLDSTLASERMPDFEKVCLESDVHLAEVAACHHILTMIVGQPALVDPESRQRMYAIGRRSEPVGANGNGAAEVSAAAATMAAHGAAVDDPSVSVDGFPTQRATQVEPAKPKVPDYLREGARQQKMTTAMIAVAAVGLTIAVLAFKDRLLSLVGFGPADTTASVEGEAGDTGSASNGASQPKAPPSASAPAEGAKPATATDGPDAAAPRDADVKQTAPPTAGDIPAAPAPRDVRADESATAPLPGRENGEPIAPGESPGAKSEDATPPPPPAPPSDGPQQPAAAPRAERAEPVGKLVSGDQLLLRFDRQAGDGGDWLRVPDNGMIFGGDLVVALPTFRPRLVLTGGLLVELIADSRDGTIVEMLAPDANGTQGLRVWHGRLAKVSAPGRQNVPLRIAFGKQVATVTLTDTTTVLAASVEHAYQPGEDPMAIAEPLLATFMTTSGAVDVAVEGQRPVMLNEAMRLTIGAMDAKVDVAAPEPLSSPPRWLDKPEVEWLDANAATQLMRDLTPTASVGVILAEQFHGRRLEGQSLAARSFGYLGRFDPLVKAALKNETLTWNWREKSLEGLRQAIRRGPATASLVRDAIAKEFGDRNGGVMYRMLCGYSPADLKGGADVRLIENLEHDELPFRSLAIFNLSSITGASLGYQPEARENQRRMWAVRWREKLQRKEIAYREAKPPAGPPSAPPSPAPGAPTPAETGDEAARDVAPLADPPAETPPPPAATPDGR
ncbi:MAG: hypothetical protein DCC68_13455 [Planctomycetota bacterium]|nr:MAG: hypothetical protein DCC68_13455 [Planctomycetota bacterium]